MHRLTLKLPLVGSNQRLSDSAPVFRSHRPSFVVQTKSPPRPSFTEKVSQECFCMKSWTLALQGFMTPTLSAAAYSYNSRLLALTHHASSSTYTTHSGISLGLFHVRSSSNRIRGARCLAGLESAPWRLASSRVLRHLPPHRCDGTITPLALCLFGEGCLSTHVRDPLGQSYQAPGFRHVILL